MICPKCGQENEGRNVCLKCGAFLQDGKKAKRYPQLSPTEKRRYIGKQIIAFFKQFAFSLLVLILAFAVLSVLFYFTYGFLNRVLHLDENLPENNPAVQSSERARETLPAAPTLPKN